MGYAPSLTGELADEHSLPKCPFPALLAVVPLSPTLHIFSLAALSASENMEGVDLEAPRGSPRKRLMRKGIEGSPDYLTVYPAPQWGMTAVLCPLWRIAQALSGLGACGWV